MDFDFSNYTYTGLLTIFAMVMGFAYPSMQSAIQRIDEKYGSSHLNDLFVSEKTYSRFQISLTFSIIAGILSPFLLSLCKNNNFHYVWNFIHTLVTLWLLTSAIDLYKSIMTYYLPKKLINKLTRKDDYAYVNALSDVIVFAAKSDQRELYLQCKREVLKYITQDLMDVNRDVQPTKPQLQKDGTKINYNISPKTINAIERLLDIICNSRLKVIYTNDTSLISVLYSDEQKISLGIRRIVWDIVSKVTMSGNKEWIIGYWEQADQRARLRKFSSLDNYNSLIKEEKEQTEFHIALCAMLIKYGKESWLTDLFFYTSSVPPRYPLLCNSLKDLIDLYKHFNERMTNPYPWYITSNYPLKGVNAGVNSDSRIYFYIRQVLALLFIRLWHMDYNVEYKEPREIIVPSNSLYENKEQQQLFENIKTDVESIYAIGLNTRVGLAAPSKDDVEKFLDKQIKVFSEKIEEIEKHPVIDEQKRIELLIGIEQVLVKTFDKESRIKEEKEYTSLSFYAQMGIDIPEDFLLKHYDKFSPETNFFTAIAQGMYRNFQLQKSYIFQTYRLAITYRIAYEYIGEALRKLKVDKNYTVLAFGLSLNNYFEYKNRTIPEAKKEGEDWTFNGAKIEETNLGSSSFLIITKAKEFPTFTLSEGEEKENFKYLNRNKSFLSNIGSLQATELDRAVVAASIKANYNSNMQFVKLTIAHEITSNKYDLDKIDPLQ